MKQINPLKNTRFLADGNIAWCMAILSALLFGSCQKELADEGLPEFCGLSQLTISSGGQVLQQYTVTYDSINRRAQDITYTLGGGPAQTLTIAYQGDSVRLSNGTIIVRDASGRVRSLVEAEGLLTDTGEFFYSYNQTGQLIERVFDDRTSEVERLTFAYTNDTLSRYSYDVLGVTNLLNGTLRYNATPRITDYTLLQYFEFLPELLPYAMLVKAGPLTPLPLAANNATVSIPGLPVQNLNSTYSGYTQSTQGFPTAYSVTIPAPSGTTTLNFAFQYRCFQ